MDSGTMQAVDHKLEEVEEHVHFSAVDHHKLEEVGEHYQIVPSDKRYSSDRKKPER